MHFQKIICLVFFVQLINNNLASQIEDDSEEELVMVQEFFRHGSRYPVYEIPDAKVEKSNFGELTHIGMQQHYILGQILKEHYIEKLHFINLTNYENEIYARTTQFNRTALSLAYQLVGLLNSKKTEEISPDQYERYLETHEFSYNYFPPWDYTSIDKSNLQLYEINSANPNDIKTAVKINVNKEEQDKEFSTFSYKTCPVVIKQDRHNKKFLDQYLQQFEKKSLEKIQGELELNLNNSGVAQYFDALVTLNFINQTNLITNKSLANLWEDITFIYNISIYLYKYQDLEFTKKLATPLLQMIIQNFGNYTTNYHGYKWFIYSVHDVNLAALLLLMNVTSIECMANQRVNKIKYEQCSSDIPTYASSIILELYQNKQTKKKSVKLRYSGQLVKFLGQNTQSVNFTQFKNILSQGLTQDYDVFCEKQLFKDQQQKPKKQNSNKDL